MEQLAQEKFVDALPDAKLRLQIHHARPRSLEDAIEFALHNEAWTIAEDARQPSGKIRGVSDQGELVHLVKELQAEMKEIREQAKQTKERRKETVCYACNQMGHIARYCKAPKRKESAEN